MHITMMRRVCATALASTILLTATAPAFAEDQGPMVSTARQDTRSIAVSYADLNLLSDSGVERLNTRVRSAAKSVCDARDARKPLRELLQSNKCFDGAMDRASQDIEVAIAEQRSGNQLASNGAPRAIGVSNQ